MLYEVDRLDTLACDAYLDRLNHPTPWTAKMMPHYRGMTRGLCSVVQSAGLGLGHFGLLTRFGSAPGAEARLAAWLATEIVAGLPQRPGLGSVHLLRGALAAQMTNEQRIRGVDGGVDWALLSTGYSQEALADLGRSDLGNDRLADHGAAGTVSTLYRSDYTLSASELRA